ncbi:MAG: DMT family transporter [Alphaproteobacteria bacterium]
MYVIPAFSLFPAADAVAKYIIDDYHLVQIVWSRFFFQGVIVLAVVLARREVRPTRTERLGLQVSCAISSWLSNFPFLGALAFIPLADVVAIELVAPLMVTALSVPFLGERVGARRWVAVVVGFLGALVIIRPGLGVVHWAAWLPLLAAVFFALYQVGTRRLGATERPIVTLVYLTAVGLVASSAVVPFFWTWPSTEAWALMAVMGALSVLAQFALVKAFDAAPASLLAPFTYAQVVSAVVVGYVVFGDFPDRWTFAGTSIVVASGLYVAYREAVARRRVR